MCYGDVNSLFLGCADTKQKLGYESENGNEVDIYVGNVESTEIIRKWFGFLIILEFGNRIKH